MFRAASLAIEEVTARSLLAACRTADGDHGAAAVQAKEVTQILERRGIGDADARSAAALNACLPNHDQPTGDQSLSSGTLRLIAG